MNERSTQSFKYLPKSNQLAVDAQYEFFESSYEHNKALMDQIFSNLQRIRGTEGTINA